MTAFTAWKFDDPDEAAHATSILRRAERDGIVNIIDHAVVSWPVGAAKASLSHGHEAGVRAAGWGAFWGFLVGAVIAVPLAGAAAGAGLAAAHKSSERLGLSEEQLRTIKEEVTEGTSVLFAVTDQGDLDRLGERFRGMPWKLVETNLTAGERAELVEALGGA